MKATILLATLKKTGLSNTETLSEFVTGRMRDQGISTEIVKLVDHRILPGTYTDMGEGDEWPVILEKLKRSDMILIATPIWWSNQSSLTQRVIERLDAIHDQVMEGERSPLEGKVGGILITGGSDGAQHIIGNLCNFLNAIGVLVPPYASLSVLWEKHAKSADTSREELLAKYEKDYAETADKMIGQMKKFLPG